MIIESISLISKALKKPIICINFLKEISHTFWVHQGVYMYRMSTGCLAGRFVGYNTKKKVSTSQESSKNQFLKSYTTDVKSKSGQQF